MPLIRSETLPTNATVVELQLRGFPQNQDQEQNLDLDQDPGPGTRDQDPGPITQDQPGLWRVTGSRLNLELCHPAAVGEGCTKTSHDALTD